MKEFTFIALAAAFAVLLVAKTDKQLKHILEGKAHRLGVEDDCVADFFAKEKRLVDVIMFSAGVATLTAGLILLVPYSLLQGIVVAFAAVFLALGIAGRLRSFHVAEKVLVLRATATESPSND